ncbi:MAG: OmpH family outer membrane protein [Bacteroidetes bacterium]|nr:OmpH family outer membrane protein [Bacteroidota bacterium]MBK8144387.1 OmpH family outer membrane protein [Bacteroidota bacterium]MBP6315318.1 OmpH family outer membrane protein [Chitinophagaceae bacterium]
MNKQFFLTIALLLTTILSFGQQKIGYINSEELILSMPEAKKADADISAYAKTFQDQLTTMQKELETKYKAYEAGAKTMSEAMLDVKQKELQDLQGRIQSTQQSAEEKVAAKRQELLKPITEKADKAIQDVAKEKGYTYILDASTGALVFATPTDNILKDVKSKLGIKDVAPASNPGGTRSK